MSTFIYLLPAWLFTVFSTLDMSRAVSMTGPGQCRLSPCIPIILDSSQLYDYTVKIMFKLHSCKKLFLFLYDEIIIIMNVLPTSDELAKNRIFKQNRIVWQLFWSSWFLLLLRETRCYIVQTNQLNKSTQQHLTWY